MVSHFKHYLNVSIEKIVTSLGFEEVELVSSKKTCRQCHKRISNKSVEQIPHPSAETHCVANKSNRVAEKNKTKKQRTAFLINSPKTITSTVIKPPMFVFRSRQSIYHHKTNEHSSFVFLFSVHNSSNQKFEKRGREKQVKHN